MFSALFFERLAYAGFVFAVSRLDMSLEVSLLGKGQATGAAGEGPVVNVHAGVV